jgi:hypothetical protein
LQLPALPSRRKNRSSYEHYDFRDKIRMLRGCALA